MHLKYGKAHYVNEISGVYRILADGIWQRLNLFEKSAIQAQSFLDYDLYFERKYHEFFMNKMWDEIKKCISYLSNVSATSDLDLREEAKEKFANCLSVCMTEHKLLTIEKKQPKKLKYRIMKKIYDYCHKKLMRKGLI